MIHEIFSLEGLTALLMLTLMEVILGIDNLIFISIVSGKLPKAQQRQARLLGLGMALGVRVAMLFGIKWLLTFNDPLFTLYNHVFTLKDIILILGGIFLIYKAITEIRHKLEDEATTVSTKKMSLAQAILQIIALDFVFSFDSILTAIGMTTNHLQPDSNLAIMVTAVMISMIIMVVFSRPVSNFVNTHPSVKMLVLAFLILIGFLLVTEGFGEEIPKGYLYFALFFSMTVEMLNLNYKKKQAKKAAQEKENESIL